jgi:hypothetical protein
MKQETPMDKVGLITNFFLNENITLQRGYWIFWYRSTWKREEPVNENGDVDQFELLQVLWYRDNIKVEATAYMLVCFKLVYHKRYVTWFVNMTI